MMFSIHTTPKVFINDNNFEPFEEAISKVPGVCVLGWDKIPYLASILSGVHSKDYYLGCPAYHAFTGRNGLWAYAKGQSMVLFARNPTNLEQIMFYPQIGEAFPNLALEIINTMLPPAGGYQFSRIEKSQAELLAASMNKKVSGYSYHVIDEPELDWRFPVHTVSTQDLLNPVGKRFKSFRQHLNVVDENRIKIYDLDPRRDIQEVMGVIESWACRKSEIPALSEMIDIYVSLLKIMHHPGLSLKGLKFYLDNELVAFEVWAMPPKGKKTANSLAGFSKTHIRGFSEFQHYTICKVLHEQGIEKICLGGSEIEGLDNFKRKMNPVESLELRSVAVIS